MGGGWKPGTSPLPGRPGFQMGARLQPNVPQVPNTPVPPAKPGFKAPLPPKSLGLLKTITAGSIESLVEIGQGHPVWLLTFKHDAGRLVIKSEIAKANVLASPSAQSGSILMGLVSPQAVSETLQPAEVNVLKSEGGSDSPLLTKCLGEVATGNRFFAKMAFVERLENIDLPKHPTAKDKAKLATLAADLKGNKQAMHSLGEVFAVDFFIGNGDRAFFDVESSRLTIGNPGNVMFQRSAKGKIVKALGLDTFDPNGGEAGKLYGTDIETWKKDYGILLKNPGAFAQIGKVIAGQLESWLAKAEVNAGLHAKDGTAIAEGLASGCNTMAKKLALAAKAGKRLPSGVMARAVWLGWIK